MPKINKVGDISQETMAYNIIEPFLKGYMLRKILLEKGSYGIKVLVDVNGNGEMDFNFFGLPKEQYGFSNNVIGLLGEPKFDKAFIEINDNKKNCNFAKVNEKSNLLYNNLSTIFFFLF